MANIRIEEKKKSGFLPWILGLLLLGLLIWGAAELFEEADEVAYEDDIEEVDEDYRPVTAVANDVDDYDPNMYMDEVNAYMNYTADMDGKLSLDHEFSHRALTLLASATAAVAEEHDVDVSANSARVKQLADEITKDPYATDHADKIRMAALQITESLERIDDEAYSAVAMNDLKSLRQEAQDITAETLTLNQKGDVRTFFGTARDILAQYK